MTIVSTLTDFQQGPPESKSEVPWRAPKYVSLSAFPSHEGSFVAALCLLSPKTENQFKFSSRPKFMMQRTASSCLAVASLSEEHKWHLSQCRS